MGTITVNRTELGKALDFASLGLAKRPTIPVLAGLLVEISAAGLKLSAFDYETSASVQVAGEAYGAGRVLVLGAELAAVVKSLPKGARVTADLTAEDDGLIVLCDGIEAVLSALPLNEYPKLPAVPAETGLVAGDAFAKAVTRVAAAAGTDDTLPSLLCVKFTGAAGRLEMAATDRYRLAVDSVTWTGPDGTDTLINARTLVAFAKKADKSGKISLHLDGNLAAFSDGTRTLITHSNPGEFPKGITKLIPADDSIVSTVLVVAAALEAAVTRAAKLLYRNAPVTLDIAEDSITVRAEDGETVKGSQVVPAVLDGEPAVIRFNPGYLASMLASAGGEAYIGIVSVTKPVRVTSDEAYGFTGVCMPIRQNT